MLCVLRMRDKHVDDVSLHTYIDTANSLYVSLVFGARSDSPRIIASSPGTKLNAINNVTDITSKFTWALDKGPLLAYDRQMDNGCQSEQYTHHLNNVVECIVKMLNCSSSQVACPCSCPLTIGTASEGPSKSCLAS